MCDERPLVTVLSSVAVQVNLEFAISAAALARVRIYDFSRRGLLVSWGCRISGARVFRDLRALVTLAQLLNCNVLLLSLLRDNDDPKTLHNTTQKQYL